MTEARWYSQPFPPSGSISAEGIKQTLGKPPIPWATILVRESAQNSWDAKLDNQTVRYTLDLATVKPQHISTWRNLLLAGAPVSSKFPLRQMLRGRDGQSSVIRKLTISDRGTKGLGGPTRADTARGDDSRNWVSFVLNVGDPPDTQKHGGGTYGYGKGVFYRMSSAGTIIVHTRTATPTGLQNRLIGICLGESAEMPEGATNARPYTGRHWWGDVRDTYVEPLFDAEATATAAMLGLPAFETDESGTDIVIIEPDFGDQTDDYTVGYLADAIAWNLWPIMLTDRGDAHLAPQVFHMGERVPVPVPEKTIGLKTFVAAYRNLESGPSESQTLSCGNPKRPLGRFSLERRLIPSFQPPDAAQDLGVAGPPHHVCLMREPELVVKYHAGPEPISANLAYGGVFRAFKDMDRTYAAAEPPTHDDWVFAQLEGVQRTLIRTTFTRIKERLAEFARPAQTQLPATQTPLGGVSNFLGSLVAASSGVGAASAPFPVRPTIGRSDGGSGHAASASPVPDPKWAASTGDGSDLEGTVGPDFSEGTTQRGNTSATRATVRPNGEPFFEDHDRELFLVQNAVVVGSGRINVRGVAGITLADGSRETDPPSHGSQPTVFGWRIGERVEKGDVIDLPVARAGQELALLVQAVPDTITLIELINVRHEGGPDGA